MTDRITQLEKKIKNLAFPKGKNCKYCKLTKPDVKFRLPKLTSQKMFLCDDCYKKSNDKGFYYTFCQPD